MTTTYPLVDYNDPKGSSMNGFDGYPDELQRTQLAFEGQLVYVSELIQQLKTHPHFTDDCGEYLSSALELAAHLSSARENGIESLYDEFIRLSNNTDKATYSDPPILPDDWLDDANINVDYASDGVSAMVTNHCRWLRETHLHDRIPFRG